MATYVNSAERYSTSDWHMNGYKISTDAERGRSASHDVRQEGRFVRNETSNKTKWDQHDNNTRLADRVDNIRKWKDILERTEKELNDEIEELSRSKQIMEDALEAMNLPEEVNVENLTTREARQGVDVVMDEVEDELKREQEVISGIKKQLQSKIAQSFEQLCVLQEARQEVRKDLEDKYVALGIDVDQYNLTEESSCISYKPDPCRVPKGSVTPQNWEDYSRYNKDRADAEIAASKRLRESNHHTLQQTQNDLNSQKKATDYAVRKRIHEFEQAKDELEWQKKQTEDEIAVLEDDIRRLSDAIRAKIKPMKLAQTRLENRTERPGVELCRDNVQYGLCDEVAQIDASKRALEEKLRQSQHALHNLEANLHRINEDLALKLNSLRLDNQVLQSRNRLGSNQLIPDTEGMRNLHLTGITRQKQHILA
ncbi:DgyrCDS1249 [Dimorphilus gyrociliatus]|uniref:Tektin n=1 Tax=Dimorphilus gyrociliatus TaxID=2664684 RepID=A0A7I8V6P7_9ANNE|nr:DgyrCDS1249 [Dimorphilus gyrociliatus]